MRIRELSRIIPALPFAAALALAPAAPAQPAPGGPMSGPPMVDSLRTPAENAAARANVDTLRDTKGLQDHRRHSGDKVDKVDKAGTGKPEAGKKTGAKKTSRKKAAHSDHDGHDHTRSLPDSTIILGTPGSPTTQGVPGTGVDGGR